LRSLNLFWVSTFLNCETLCLAISASTNRDLLDMDASKIHEFIKLLEEHQSKCEVDGRFVEAEMAKQRVSQFKKVETQKRLRDLKSNHDNTRKKIEEEHKIELDTFNEDMDKRYYDINERYESNQKAMADQYEHELAKRIEEVNMEHPVHHKGSTDYLNLQKKLEHIVKQKDYTKAHEIQQQMNNLHNGEKDEWENEKQAKIERETQKIRLRQENEKQVYHKKMGQVFVEFKKTRALETEMIIQKYKNKLKQHDNSEKCQTNEFHRPLRTAMKNAPFKPSSTQNKTTGGGFLNVKG